MFDKVINRIGVSLSLLLIICELTYVNAKSLLSMVPNAAPIDTVMSWVGSLAFSMVTVVVMRKANNGWFKIIFPLFDSALVFLGFNISNPNTHDNPVHLWLSLFFAVFTGFITYALGLINRNEHKSDSNSLVNDFEVRESELTNSYNSLMETHNSVLHQFNSLSGELKSVKSENSSLKNKINSLEAEMATYKASYLASERSRILKKKEENRTEQELAVLAESETT